MDKMQLHNLDEREKKKGKKKTLWKRTLNKRCP